jgi:hypothetical protein
MRRADLLRGHLSKGMSAMRLSLRDRIRHISTKVPTDVTLRAVTAS